MTQCDQIRAALLAGESMTPIDALHRFGCFRLGARVYDLKQDGLQIDSARVEVEPGTYVARYSMTLEARRAYFAAQDARKMKGAA